MYCFNSAGLMTVNIRQKFCPYEKACTGRVFFLKIIFEWSGIFPQDAHFLPLTSNPSYTPNVDNFCDRRIWKVLVKIRLQFQNYLIKFLLHRTRVDVKLLFLWDLKLITRKKPCTKLCGLQSCVHPSNHFPICC